jgi:hypothetical protein
MVGDQLPFWFRMFPGLAAGIVWKQH